MTTSMQPISTPLQPNMDDAYLVVVDSSGDSNQSLQILDLYRPEHNTNTLQDSARNRLSSFINTASVGVGAGRLDTTCDTRQAHVDTRGSNAAQRMAVESDMSRVRITGSDTVLYDTSGNLFGQSGDTREKYIDIRTCNAGQPTNSEHQQARVTDNFHELIMQVMNTELNPDVNDTHEINHCSNVYETVEYKTPLCSLKDSVRNDLHDASLELTTHYPSESTSCLSGHTREKYIDISTLNAGQITHSEHFLTLNLDDMHQQVDQVNIVDALLSLNNRVAQCESTNVYDSIEYN